MCEGIKCYNDILFLLEFLLEIYDGDQMSAVHAVNIKVYSSIMHLMRNFNLRIMVHLHSFDYYFKA